MFSCTPIWSINRLWRASSSRTSLRDQPSAELERVCRRSVVDTEGTELNLMLPDAGVAIVSTSLYR